MEEYEIKDLEFHEGDIFFPVRDNPKIKKIGSHTIITPERGAEILKCMEDPIYFCRNYLKLITLDHGLQPFHPRPYQIKTITSIIENRFVIAKWGRQSGKCVTQNTIVKIRNKKTGEVKEIPIGELYEMYRDTNTTMKSSQAQKRNKNA